MSYTVHKTNADKAELKESLMIVKKLKLPDDCIGSSVIPRLAIAFHALSLLMTSLTLRVNLATEALVSIGRVDY